MEAERRGHDQRRGCPRAPTVIVVGMTTTWRLPLWPPISTTQFLRLAWPYVLPFELLQPGDALAQHEHGLFHGMDDLGQLNRAVFGPELHKLGVPADRGQIVDEAVHADLHPLQFA